MGESDIAGTLQVDTSGKRPFLQGEIQSRLLDFADLGPVIGTEKPAKGGVLPDAPFEPDNWNTVDADVKIQATKIQRPEQLPIDNLATRLQMRDALLTLDPLEFGIAGGRLAGQIRLDGRQSPIKAATTMRLNRLKLEKLVPTDNMKNTSIGDVSGAIELAGTGNSVARMLGSANGKIGVFVDGGEISHFLMELVAIDLWGIAKVALKGDEPINIRCMIADFGVKNGVMEANALVFDTAVVNINGGGTVNLKSEEMALKLVPEPKDRSLASLNTPLYIQGTFSDPKVGPDVGKIAAKGLGAVVLGIVNPILSVIPLFKEGKGRDSNCEALIADAAKVSGKKPKPRPR
jgi:AsmA protein